MVVKKRGLVCSDGVLRVLRWSLVLFGISNLHHGRTNKPPSSTTPSMVTPQRITATHQSLRRGQQEDIPRCALPSWYVSEIEWEAKIYLIIYLTWRGTKLDFQKGAGG